MRRRSIGAGAAVCSWVALMGGAPRTGTTRISGSAASSGIPPFGASVRLLSGPGNSCRPTGWAVKGDTDGEIAAEPARTPIPISLAI